MVREAGGDMSDKCTTCTKCKYGVFYTHKE